MTSEKYLVCDKCKQQCFATKNGKLNIEMREDKWGRKSHILSVFIEDHEYDCNGELMVVDECCIDYDIKIVG